jgi:hypothetical protein
VKKAPSRIVAAAAGVASLFVFSGTASAAKPYDPNVARIANPANVCKSIPGSIEFASNAIGAPVPDLSWFDYSDCVNTAARGAHVVPGFGSPYEQCAMLIQFGAFSYPATLHSGESGPEEDFLLPDLTVRNDRECGNALYAYHVIASTVFGPPPE